MLDRFFGLSEHHTNVKTELLAGLTTFLTMAYIIFLQPMVLSGKLFGQPNGMDEGAVMTATCLCAALATAIMGLYARYPIAQAPGMGENFIFVLTVIPAAGAMIAAGVRSGSLEEGATTHWQVALGVVFIAGVLFLVISLLGAREALLNAISPSMRNAIAVGIGLFIAFIGLQGATLVVGDPGHLVKMNPHVAAPDLIVFFFGLFLTAGLYALRIRGSIVWGILGATLLSVLMQLALPHLPYPAHMQKVIAHKTTGAGLTMSVQTSWRDAPPGSNPVRVTLTPAAPPQADRALTVEFVTRPEAEGAVSEGRTIRAVTIPVGSGPVQTTLTVPELAGSASYAIEVREDGQPLEGLCQDWTPVPHLPAIVAQSRLMTWFKTADGVVSRPPSMGKTFMKMDLVRALWWPMIPFILIFLFMDLFDTLGTLVGVSEQAGFIKDNKLPRAREALLSDAVGTVAGAVCGTSTVTSYIESASGVEQGGRTGLTALTVAALFLLALLFSPVIRMVGSYPSITAPALVVVGSMMMRNVTKIDWSNYAEGMPAFITFVGIALTYSIADGLALGFISYPIIKLCAGQGRDVKWLMYVMGAVLAAYLVFVRAQAG